MHQHFISYIKFGKSLAKEKSLIWNFDLDENGYSDIGWNLSKVVGSTTSPAYYLKNLGIDLKFSEALHEEKIIIQNQPIDSDWQDLIKAATCEQLLYKRNSLSHITVNIIRPLKVIATYCLAGNIKPWDLTPEVIDKTSKISKRTQKSGKLADLILGVTKNIIDANHLSILCPIYPALLSKRLNPINQSRKSNFVSSQAELLERLEQRKSQAKLPEKRAFWELIRIIFTEKPKSFTDALRFSALKVILITGLRITEAVCLPLDWKRTRDYYDPNGKPAGELGGYSSSLLLRHFAEKQHTGNSVEFFENTQCVPKIFEEILNDTLVEMARITQPLRNTLKLQCETDRLFPWYTPSENIPVRELYTRLTGNPFWLKMDSDHKDKFIERYLHNFEPEILSELDVCLKEMYSSKGTQLDMAMYVFFNRLVLNKQRADKPLSFVRYDGTPYFATRFKWDDVYLNIGKLEEHLRQNLPTKISDVSPINMTTGEFQAWEFMFLLPKRALSGERNEGITDVNRYYAIGIPEAGFLQLALGEQDSRESIFLRYGETDEDKSLKLLSHSLRHLQNTELFRLGVADTIITKRFNRHSVAQSYEYDHRSLSESLNAIELPEEIEMALGEKSSTVAKLIHLGKASGPIVDNFKQIQREQGDQMAFEYLRVEADGFHATPYGHCINSFTVEPCPKNLECFAGCRNLTATQLPENTRNLEALAQKFEVAISEVQARPINSIGRDNQISHATIRLENIRKLLNTPAGQSVFPDGPDLSKPTFQKSVLDD